MELNLKIYEESLFYKDGIQKKNLQGVKPKVVYITGGKLLTLWKNPHNS